MSQLRAISKTGVSPCITSSEPLWCPKNVRAVHGCCSFPRGFNEELGKNRIARFKTWASLRQDRVKRPYKRAAAGCSRFCATQSLGAECAHIENNNNLFPERPCGLSHRGVFISARHLPCDEPHRRRGIALTCLISVNLGWRFESVSPTLHRVKFGAFQCSESLGHVSFRTQGLIYDAILVAQLMPKPSCSPTGPPTFDHDEPK